MTKSYRRKQIKSSASTIQFYSILDLNSTNYLQPSQQEQDTSSQSTFNSSTPPISCKLQISLGIVPTKLFFSTFKISKKESPPKLEGISPESWLRSKARDPVAKGGIS
jgi:hypothetical protein